MCGIVGGYIDDLSPALAALAHRGPDAAGAISAGSRSLGHTRLAILDLDPRSNQPFTYRQITLVFNGEIWNFLSLKAELQTLGYSFTTSGDTEVLAAALSCWGEDALPKLEGMFALAWIDATQEGIFLARDPFGETPLHLSLKQPFLFASEKKGLIALGVPLTQIAYLAPGELAHILPTRLKRRRWRKVPLAPSPDSPREAASQLREKLTQGVTNRLIGDVPLCVLLSGGLDSSVIAYLISQQRKVVAYTACFDPKSPDLKAARLMAKTLGIELREVPIPLPNLSDLATVIQAIEMPYKTQIEIGWACLCLARQLQADGFKVVLSGEGSDELWASYGFSWHGVKKLGWFGYRRELFQGQHKKNFARCNKVFMRHSIECRLPFLDTSLVDYALNLPVEIVRQEGQLKGVLTQAFARELPPVILRRAKLAFQTGLGLTQALARKHPDPQRLYHTIYAKQFGPVKELTI